MLLFVFPFCLFSYNIIFVCSGFIQDKLFDGIILHVDRFAAKCSNGPIQGFTRGVKTESTKILVANFTIIVRKGGFKKLMLTITIDRCDSKENLDSCEQYIKQPNIDFCKAIDPDNYISTKSPFYAPYEPPLKCPVQKGIYHAYNVSYDLAPFMFFKVEGWYWRITNEVVSGEELVYCWRTEGYVTYSKSKKN